MPESSAVLGELKEIIRQELRRPVNDLDPDSQLSDLGLDSLARVRVLVAVERRYGIEVDEDRATKITKISDFLNLIEGGKVQ